MLHTLFDGILERRKRWADVADDVNGCTECSCPDAHRLADGVRLCDDCYAAYVSGDDEERTLPVPVRPMRSADVTASSRGPCFERGTPCFDLASRLYLSSTLQLGLDLIMRDK